MLIFPALVSGSDYYPRYSLGKWSHDGLSSISTPSNVIRYRSQMFFTDYPSKTDTNSIRPRYPIAFQWRLQKRGSLWLLASLLPLRISSSSWGYKIKSCRTSISVNVFRVSQKCTICGWKLTLHSSMHNTMTQRYWSWPTPTAFG